MAPAADLNGAASIPQSGIAVTQIRGDVEGQPGSWKLAKSLNKNAPSECPVQGYEDAVEAPYEFVIKDPTSIPTRRSGNDDDETSQLLAPEGVVKVPVIDLTPLMVRGADPQGAKEVVAEIGRACEEWGLFQVVNHGISENLLDRLLEVANEFFRLPLKEKQEYAVIPGEEEGYGRLDYNSRERCWSDCLRHTVRPRPVPGVGLVVDKPPTYRPLLEEYTEGVEKVLQVLWTSLSEYLGLEFDSLRKAQEDNSQLVIRLNYYPRCPQPEKVFGLVGHKDSGTMTVLLQDDVGGLQVQKLGTDVWVDVEPMKGSLVINIAKQLEMLSNGRFNSAMHRALVNQSKTRLSVAMLATPSPNCVIRPLQELLDKTHQAPRFKPLVFGDYIPNLKADSKAGLDPYARYEILPN